MPYTFEPLDSSRHDRAAFSCGEPALDTYLKIQASQDMKRDLALCWVLCEQGSTEIIAYYTLTPCSVEVAALPRELARSAGRYHTVPAVLLGRMGVDTKHRGQGIGGHVLLDALRRCLRAGFAVKLIVVDALHETAAGFYLHHGFKRLREDAPLRLYVPMTYVRTLFPAEAPAEDGETPPTAPREADPGV